MIVQDLLTRSVNLGLLSVKGLTVLGDELAANPAKLQMIVQDLL
jgi:hypothetical protein